MGRLHEYRLTNSAKSKPQPEKPQKKTFVQNSLTPRFLRHDDTVLILVPEDLEITGSIDPALHGRVCKIISTVCDKDYVDISLVHKATTGADWDYSYADCYFSTPEIVTVPTFCLSLEKNLLHHRMNNPRAIHEEFQLARTSRSNSLPDLDEGNIDEVASPKHHSIGIAGNFFA
jgi:hypothetical protein